MNILFISQLFPSDRSQFYTNGALYDFIKEWDSMGHSINVVRPHFSYEKETFPKLTNYSLWNNTNVHFIKPLRVPILKYTLYPAQNIIKKLNIKPDVIICHLYNSFFGFSGLAKRLDIPLIIGVHKSDIQLAGKEWFKSRMKRVFNQSAGFACRSYAISKRFLELFPEYEERTFVALSGIDKEKINESFGEKTSNSIVSVCNLLKLKNLDLVIHSLAKIPKNISWKYTIVGDGPEMNKLKELSNKLNLNERITFLGQQPNHKVFEILEDTDIFIMPSVRETLGIAYLEAMGTGNIVIGTKGWGIDGVILDGVNGFLCDPDSLNSVQEKLENLLTMDPIEKEKIRNASFETIRNYTKEKKAKDYIEQISKLIAK